MATYPLNQGTLSSASQVPVYDDANRQPRSVPLDQFATAVGAILTTPDAIPGYSLVLATIGAPDNSVGSDGSLSVDAITGAVYKKAAGSWALLSAGAGVVALTVSGAPVLSATAGQQYAGFLVSASGGVPPYTYSDPAGSLPDGLSVHPTVGLVSGVPLSAGESGAVALVARDVLGDQAILAPFNITTAAPGSPLALSGSPVTSAQVGVPYSFSISASGGEAPYTYAVASGSLPAGVTLNASTGLVSGTPTTEGTASGIVLNVTDDAGTAASLPPFSVVVAAAVVPLSISGTPATSATVGTPYSFTPAAAGGAAPYTFSLIAGTLPAGLSFSTSTGAITGTPTTAESAPGLSIRVTDNVGATATLPSFGITVSAAATAPGAPTIGSATAGNGTVSVSFTAPASTGGSPITGYQVLLSNGNNATGAASPISVTTPNGTAVTATVRAQNAIGYGPYSAASNSVTPSGSVTVPGAPTAVSAVPGDAQAVVSFTAPSSTGGSAITGYRVTSSTGQTATGSASPITITGLTNGTATTFTVAAQNAAGYGAESTASPAVTPAAPLPEPTVQSMMLPAFKPMLTSSAEITDNLDGTWTGTASTAGNARLANGAVAGVVSTSDTWMALEWRGGGDVAVCFAGSNTQSWTGGRWLVIKSTGIFARDAGVETPIQVSGSNIVPTVGQRFRLSRVGTEAKLQIDVETVDTGAWVNRYEFPAVIGTGTLFVVMRTTTGILKPMQGYGVQHASQSQWIEPGFLSEGGSTFVSTAGTQAELFLAKLDSNRLRGANQTVATIAPADDHNRLAVLKTTQNKMLAAYTGHNENFYCNRLSLSDYGLDFQVETRIDTGANTISYVQLFQVPSSNRIVRIHRSGGATSGGWNLLYSDDYGATWTGTKRLLNLTYMWGKVSPTNPALVYIHAYPHPIGTSPNNIYLFILNLTTGDISHPNGTVVANWQSSSSNPLFVPASVLQVVAADGTPASTRFSDVIETGTSRALAIVRFDKGAVDTTGNLVVARYVDSASAYAETTVRTAGPAFSPDNAYYPAHCFGADANTVYAAYCTATGTGTGGASATHQLRKYTWDSGTSTWVAGSILRQIVGIISRPRYHEGWLYWSELSSYVGSGTFSFEGNFNWQYVG